MPITSRQLQDSATYEAHQSVAAGPFDRQKDYVDDLLFLQVRGELTDTEFAAFERVRAHDWITCSCEAWHKYCECDYRNNLEANWNGQADFEEERVADEGHETVADLYREL